MRTSLRIAGCMLAACALLAGCAPVSLVQLDNDWARTYAAMAEVERDNADFLVSLTRREALELELERIAGEAELAGDRQLERDPTLAVGFYRVAASAAWKSGAERQLDVYSISRKGADACARLERRDASQPRDCMFLQLVPQLARYDAKLSEVRALTTSPRLDEPQVARALGLADELLQSLNAVLRTRTDAVALSLPPNFFDYVAANATRQYCTVSALAGAIALSNPPATAFDKLRAAVNGTERQLEAASISRVCT